MNSKKFFSIILSGLYALTLVSCDFGSEDKENLKQPGTQEVEIVNKAMTAIGAAEGEATTSTKALKGITNITYNGTGWSVTGTYEEPDSGTYPITLDLQFTFTTYTYGDVQLVSGTVNYYIQQTDDYSFTYGYDGNFVMIYDGVTYNITWNIDLVVSANSYTYTGTFTINGESYGWNATYTY